MTTPRAEIAFGLENRGEPPAAVARAVEEVALALGIAHLLDRSTDELSGGELEWTDGMLYPLLHRLRRLRYVTTEWRTPPEGRRRRYYALTDDGRAALVEQQRQWATVTRALGDVWRSSGGWPTALGEA